MQDKPNDISREELLKKLENEFKESETLQWFIETEIRRIMSKNCSYEELKKLAEISRDSISSNAKK